MQGKFKVKRLFNRLFWWKKKRKDVGVDLDEDDWGGPPSEGFIVDYEKYVGEGEEAQDYSHEEEDENNNEEDKWEVKKPELEEEDPRADETHQYYWNPAPLPLGVDDDKKGEEEVYLVNDSREFLMAKGKGHGRVTGQLLDVVKSPPSILKEAKILRDLQLKKELNKDNKGPPILDSFDADAAWDKWVEEGEVFSATWDPIQPTKKIRQSPAEQYFAYLKPTKGQGASSRVNKKKKKRSRQGPPPPLEEGQGQQESPTKNKTIFDINEDYDKYLEYLEETGGFD